MVARGGIEPPTRGFSVCSSDDYFALCLGLISVGTPVLLRQRLRFAKQSLGIGWLDICGSLRTAATGHNIVFENQASAVRRPEILGDYGHRSACPWKYID